MNLLGAIGNCLLAFTTEFEVICALLPKKQVVGVWPVHCLRRYWCEDGVFAFEAGRRSPRGEGSYSFVSSHNEEIYRTLDRLILKAKKCDSSSSTGSVDDRPPAPLPVDALKPETPISSSESDDEGSHQHKKPSNLYLQNGSSETTPLASKVPLPQAGSGTRMTTSLRHPPAHNPDVSGNPTYLRRARTLTGTRGWLHESVQQSPEAELKKPKRRSVHNQPLPPPPAAYIEEEIKTRDPLEEDTYSHTVHPVPAPFEQGSFNASLYNALVHPLDPAIKRQQRSSAVDDFALYDIAFPPTSLSKGRRLLSQDAEYGTVTNPDSNIIPRTKMPVNKLPLSLGKPKEVLKQPLNPLYGSQEDLLAAMEPAQEKPGQSSPRLARLPSGSGKTMSELLKTFQPPREETDDAPPPGQLRKKSEDDGLTANPLYGSQDKLLDALKLQTLEDSVEVDPSRWYKPPESGNEIEEGQQTPERKGSPEIRDGTPTGEGEETGATVKPSEAMLVEQQNADEQQSGYRESTPTGILRDAKGYTKIDKSRKVEEEEGEGEDAVVAPPIPQRNYSWDSSNSSTI